MEEKCYLEKGDFPPLSELDHKTKNCYCYLCTCGKHNCPSLNSYQIQPPKLTSSYRVKFTKKQPSPPPKPFSYMNELIASKQDMVLKSTKQEDFKAFLIESPKKSPYDTRYRSVSPFKLNGNSTYSRNYISYGPLQKSPYIKVNSEYSPIKFMGTSTYAQQFIKHGKIADNFDKQLKRKNILGAGGISILESTNASAYKGYKETFLSKPFRHSSVDERSIGNSSPPNVTSTYASSFYDISPKNLIPTLKQFEKSL